jgi:selenocysteine-specific elongation factor
VKSQPLRRLVLGTAGHVDHGKTALVKALTGVDTDRLKEEKARGITIALGFAELVLPGYSIGLVDVPGHERFVRAMAAGAGGIDLVLLIIACDEGVMPQTREHLDICRLLGVRRGVVALTKSDLLPGLGAEWLPLLRTEVEGLARGTFLEGADVVPVSARTGEGLDDLSKAIDRIARATDERPSTGAPFLAIDRAFSLKGFGTVVTGTLISGSLRVGDDIDLAPGGVGPLRMRSLQSHGRDLTVAQAGQRVAVNLPGIEVSAVARGTALTSCNAPVASAVLDAEIESLPEAFMSRRAASRKASKPAPPRVKLLCHLGTAQVNCTVKPAGGWPAPGVSVKAQLRFDRPIAALPGQHFILRGFRELQGRGRTVAGGRVLAHALAQKRGVRSAPLDAPPTSPSLAVAPQAPLDSELLSRLSGVLAAAGLAPPTRSELGAQLGTPLTELGGLLDRAVASGTVVKVADDLHFDAHSLEDLGRRLVAHLSQAGRITTQEFKELSGVSRKFCIPLAEYFDRRKVTLRVGETRVLRRGIPIGPGGSASPTPPDPPSGFGPQRSPIALPSTATPTTTAPSLSDGEDRR